MDKVQIERLGGLGGFGLAEARVQSMGECTLADLSTSDRTAVASLFDGAGHRHGSHDPRDGFRYKLTLLSAGRRRSVEVPEAVVPPAIRDRAVDRLI